MIASSKLGSRLDLAVLAIASIIVVIILCAPLLAVNGHPASAAAIYAAFAPLCHQRPDRSLFVEGMPMAVCTRCFGIYLGFFLGMLLLMLLPSLKPAEVSFRWLLLSMLPLIIDGLGGWVGLFTNTHFSRCITGLIAGAGVAAFIFCAIKGNQQIDEQKWT